MKGVILAGLAAAALLALSGGAGAASTTPPFDQWFLQASIQGDRFEVAGGTFAQQHSGNSAVKTLAVRLVKDHSKSLSDSIKLAHSLHVSVPPAATPSQQWELQQVKSMSGSDFDRAYASLEVKDHQEDISMAQDELKMGQDPQVKAEAKKDLPMLKMHLLLSQKALKATA
jgi:putative membrane protein